MKDKLSYGIVVSAFILIGIMCMIYSTQWGIGVTTDSKIYIGVARNLAAGNWFTTSGGGPMTHFPPLYPLLLSLTGLFGLDLLVGARWLHVMLFGCNVLLVALVVNNCTQNSFFTSAFGALMTVSSVSMVDIHAMAWSEPAFVFFGLWGLFLLSRYVGDDNRFFLITSAILVGLAFLTKYVGVSLVITGMLGLVLLGKKSLVKKIIDACIWGGLSSAPMALWVIRNNVVAGTSTNRKFVYHPISIEYVQTVVDNISYWFCWPDSFPIILRGGFITIITAGMVIACVVLFRKDSFHDKKLSENIVSYFPGLATLFLFVHVSILAFSISFIDAHTPMTNRILSPLYFIGLAAFLCIIHNLVYSFKAGRKIVIIIILLYFYFAVAQLLQAGPFISNLGENGQGFASQLWKQAQILQFIKTLPRDIKIYSNGTDALEILEGVKSKGLPVIVDPGTRKKNEKFMLQLRAMVDNLVKSDGVIIYFNYITWRRYLPEKAALEKNLPLQTLYNGPDGSVYKIDKSQTRNQRVRN